MTSHQLVRMAELENQAFSLMGRLHVVMRRETGRITDIEYMRIDPAYCRYLIQLAMHSEQADLQKIGERLDSIYFGEEGLFVIAPPKPPLLSRFTQDAAAAPKPPAAAAPKPSPPPAAVPPPHMPAAPAIAQPHVEDQHYVGRLR